MTAVEELLKLAGQAEERGQAGTAEMFRKKAAAGEEQAKITLWAVRAARNWAKKELGK